MHTRITVLAAIVAGALMTTSVAIAAEGDVVIEGTGKLVAAGVGDVEIEGGGQVRLKMSGDVTITDSSGDSDIVIRSAGDGHTANTDTDSTTITLDDFTGIVTVQGTDFSISASGKFRRVAARGTGSVLLQGRGWYRIRGGQHGIWTSDGIQLSDGSGH